MSRARRLLRPWGCSLVEMLVALALVAVILVVGTALLIEFLHHAEVRATKEPLVGTGVDVALDALDKDLREAVTVRTAGTPGETGESLVKVVFADGGKVAWRQDSDRLIRLAEHHGDIAARETVVCDALSSADVEVLGQLATVDLRAKEGPPRHRAVLLRNLGRTPASEGTP